ncbi:hypothetical protein QZJ86_12205 [Methylomonas montana]|uniref:hypothetical protein n=1 Tax=Methylomonas montana TaxID=3058963 RepID=UPI0026592E3E|nr:hypothetical protein [Methylomonas montana]WKJ88785.1 hypothetical protein QZJ86_12205 [Methylomonas montana]
MLIAEKTLKDTVTFIVAQFHRDTKSAQDLDACYQNARSELAGISKLLIGRREHAYTELALIDLKKIYDKCRKAEAA